MTTTFPSLCIDDLIKYQRPVPRYTSYPPVPSWSEVSSLTYEDVLARRAKRKDQPISLYIHVPFCKTMCLFCGCHVILNRLLEQRLHYADLVDKEIEMLGRRLPKVPISQLHLGGGTPTYMPLERLKQWLEKLSLTQGFTLDAEISIEVDPRTVMESEGGMLGELKQMGFNRVSFGVQDLDEEVQQAIARRQSAKMSYQTLIWAKEAGFESVNVDLIYGLPRQTQTSFENTIRELCTWKPSRVALFSYANVPWMKAHQKVIANKLPSAEEKLNLYLRAREIFLANGYEQIGMDHFALESDEMAIGLKQKRLHRNFQGYSLYRSADLIGLGVSATGFVDGLYVQNRKEIKEYQACLENDQFSVYRGKKLDVVDERRYWVIQRVMCDFQLHFNDYNLKFDRDFARDFAFELTLLGKEDVKDLVILEKDFLRATALGKIFIRIVASCFDAYLQEPAPNKFSMSI